MKEYRNKESEATQFSIELLALMVMK